MNENLQTLINEEYRSVFKIGISRSGLGFPVRVWDFPFGFGISLSGLGFRKLCMHPFYRYLFNDFNRTMKQSICILLIARSLEHGPQIYAYQKNGESF